MNTKKRIYGGDADKIRNEKEKKSEKAEHCSFFKPFASGFHIDRSFLRLPNLIRHVLD